ncbi:hypothetical protein, partial [Planomicrobium soli]|uniref:hypothetical protein n=1 Tax=Planomicrobium soli TaxID=1176648 RepID=UPI001C628033
MASAFSGCRETLGSFFHFAPGGRFPRARPQPLPSLRSVQGLRLALVPLESPPSAPFATFAGFH